MGLGFFEAERMVGVIGDARASVPAEGPPRIFISYTGTYSFDGEVLITKADDASRPELIVDQVRKVLFDGPNRFTAVWQEGHGKAGGRAEAAPPGLRTSSVTGAFWFR